MHRTSRYVGRYHRLERHMHRKAGVGTRFSRLATLLTLAIVAGSVSWYLWQRNCNRPMPILHSVSIFIYEQPSGLLTYSITTDDPASDVIGILSIEYGPELLIPRPLFPLVRHRVTSEWNVVAACSAAKQQAVNKIAQEARRNDRTLQQYLPCPDELLHQDGSAVGWSSDAHHIIVFYAAVATTLALDIAIVHCVSLMRHTHRTDCLACPICRYPCVALERCPECGVAYSLTETPEHC